MNITIPGGTTKRLLTAGKYCLSDILVTAEGSASRLPEGYTELEYIESTGTQYINTDVAGGMPLKVEMVLETTTGTSSVDKMVFASYDGTNNTIPVYWYKGTWFTEVDKTTGQSAGGTLADNTRYNVVFDATSAKYSLVVNGSTLVEKTGSLTGSTKPLFLFARNNNGTASHHATAKVYGLKMYNNNVLVRDFVPCINPYGEIGLYDCVNGRFYGNSGTGVFSCNLDFANCTWAQVVEACQTNTIPPFWAVGSSKSMVINGSEYQIDIIGKNHDTYADGSGTAPLTFQMHECYGSGKRMNSSATSAGGWTSCEMRNTTLPALLATMPSEVQAGIKEVSKRTVAGSTGTNSTIINTTADKLFLLSEVEVFGSRYYSPSIDEGTQYEYYAAGNSKIKYTGTTAQLWWERSPLTAEGFFCAVSTTGDFEGYQAHTNRYVSFAFCF